MSSSTKNTNTAPEGIRISNLDSTDQAQTWRKLVFPCPQGNDSAFFWDASSHACEFEINNNTELVQYFAQCLRTAYLTNKRITLTYQEVLDGTFFLAFGPGNINKILGLSPKDESAIYIRTHSDKHKTLKDALIDSFTTHNKAHDYSINSAFEHACLAACPGLYATATSQPEPAQLPHGFENRDDYIEILTAALETTYGLQHSQLSFLAQRWQEWIDAADRGVVRFVPKDCSVGVFDFHKQFAKVQSVLEDYLPTTGLAANIQDEIRKAVSQPRRSDAFSQLKTIFGNAHYANRTDAHTFTRDLYQYVYQMTLADQYHCTLMTVQDAEDDSRIHDNVFVDKFKEYMKKQPQERFNYSSISGKTTALVGQMPAAFFTSVLYTSRDSIRLWRRAEGTAKAKAARELDYAIKTATSQINRKEDIRSTALRGGVAIVLAIIGWILDEWQFGGNGGIWLSAGIAFLISVGPEIVDLWNSLRDISSGPETFFAQF